MNSLLKKGMARHMSGENPHVGIRLFNLCTAFFYLLTMEIREREKAIEQFILHLNIGISLTF